MYERYEVKTRTDVASPKGHLLNLFGVEQASSSLPNTHQCFRNCDVFHELAQLLNPKAIAPQTHTNRRATGRKHLFKNQRNLSSRLSTKVESKPMHDHTLSRHARTVHAHRTKVEFSFSFLQTTEFLHEDDLIGNLAWQVEFCADNRIRH